MRKTLFGLACLVLFLMVGCGASSHFGVSNKALIAPGELKQTEDAIADAEKSQGAQFCPDKIAKAKEIGKQAAETYWACHTAEAMDLLAQARQMAKEAESCRPAPVAAAPKPVPAPAPPKQIEFERVYFDFDKSAITPTGEEVLKRNLKILEDNPSIVVEVWGHTDEKGQDAYNMKLSQTRANAVRDWLVSHGISPDRVKAQWYGQTKPREPNDTEEGRKMNRRVGFHIIGQ
jgi:outer membrane protein OmpA-like peptidoglycan-associated protein